MYGMQSKINQILRGAETIRRNSREEWKERAEKAEAELERIYAGMQGSCYCCEPVGEMNQKLQAEVERLKVINADMRNFLSKAIHNEGFNEEQALKFIYQ